MTCYGHCEDEPRLKHSNSTQHKSVFNECYFYLFTITIIQSLTIYYLLQLK